MYSIGVLHGCRQDKIIIESLLKDYVKKIKKYTNNDCKISYLDGQYDHTDKGKMWYKTTLDLGRIGTDDISESDIDETLNYINSFVKENNINILIGFSQGGNVVSTYLRLRNKDKHIVSAAIISGYDFPRYLDNEIDNVNLVTVYSESDNIVDYRLTPKSKGLDKILTHLKGHKIYSGGKFITNFIESLLSFKSEF